MRKSRKTSRFVFTDIRDLYELLLQKEALENRLQQQQLQGLALLRTFFGGKFCGRELSDASSFPSHDHMSI
ncbi:hypothetical protein Cfor_07336 [Coptotermes formosanus]|uniref:Uncharacterized protein n=1 Tax=Coptotermes formosanus TaxID=36987 RepID=A0A6L2P8B7_COPFO|nr:hypothetical protein Cfor_07336 [Coptotermes formosanus]